MLDRLEGSSKIAASILLFPMLFQGPFVEFAWGAGDDFFIAIAKRIFLLLPMLALLFGCWISIGIILSIPFRHKRRQFISMFFVTWWDLGRAIFAFWGGIFKFVFNLVGWIVGLVRLVGLTFLLALKDVLMTPIRLVGDVSQGYFKPGIPWPALVMMAGWSLLEALIFTFVMTPLVQDVLSGLAGKELEGLSLQIPLYLTFVVFVLGSYAVLHSLEVAVKTRNVPKIINNLVVEVIVMMVEVVFLYREFVDALVPWFAQHAGEGFELGIAGTLGIATFAWLGIRAMTWFLFGQAAVPMMMAMIQRTGIEGEKKGLLAGLGKKDESSAMFVYIRDAWSLIKKDLEWVEERGEALLSAFIIPPSQLVAVCINFCTFFVSKNHLFELPFKNYQDILEARTLLANAKRGGDDA